MKELPDIFQIEITSYCNLQCTMCPYSRMTRLREHMSWETLEIISDCLMPGQALGLHVMGEPLLHPELIDMIEFLSYENDVQPEFATNGTIMSYNIAEHLIESGLSRIWFSFDAGTKEAYEEIRVGASFDKVVANIHTFLDVNSAHGNPVQVSIQKVGPTTDEADAQAFLKLWEGYDARVKFMDSWAGTMNLDKIEKPTKKRYPCAEPWNRVAILVNGDVVPCCRDWEPKYVYGNIHNETLGHIWHGAAANKLRNDMLSGNYAIEPCKSCNEWAIEMDREVTEIGE